MTTLKELQLNVHIRTVQRWCGRNKVAKVKGRYMLTDEQVKAITLAYTEPEGTSTNNLIYYWNDCGNEDIPSIKAVREYIRKNLTARKYKQGRYVLTEDEVVEISKHFGMKTVDDTPTKNMGNKDVPLTETNKWVTHELNTYKAQGYTIPKAKGMTIEEIKARIAQLQAQL